MADERMKIELAIDRSKADRELRAFHEAERKRQAESVKAQADAQKAIERNTREASRRAEQEKKRLDDRVLKDTEISELAKAEIFKKVNRQRIQEITRAHKTEIDLANQAAAETAKKAAAQRAALVSLASSVGLPTAAFGALTMAIGAATREMELQFKRARDQARELGREVGGLHADLKGIAALRGVGTDEEMKRQVGIVARTGLSLSDARDLTSGAETGASGFANAAEFAEALKRGGQLAAIGGLSASDAGGAIGFLGEMGEGLTADQIESELVRAENLGTIGRFGGASGLFNRVREQRDAIASGRLSTAEASGLLAQFGAGRRGGASRLARQAISSVGSVDAANYMAQLGASDASALEQIKAVSDDLARAQARGVQDLSGYLEEQGITDSLGVSALMEFHRGRGRFDRDIAPLIGGDFRGDIGRRFAERADDPAMRQSMVGAAGDLAKVQIGERSMFREQARRMAYEQMRARGETRASYEDFQTSASPWNLFGAQARGETTGQLDRRAFEMLAEQAREAGVDFSFGSEAERLGRGIITTGETRLIGEDERDERFNELARLIQQQGGQALPGLDQFAEGARLIHDAAARLSVSPPLQGAPQQPPSRAQ